jgi:hypothetical protein
MSDYLLRLNLLGIGVAEDEAMLEIDCSLIVCFILSIFFLLQNKQSIFENELIRRSVRTFKRLGNKELELNLK